MTFIVHLVSFVWEKAFQHVSRTKNTTDEAKKHMLGVCNCYYGHKIHEFQVFTFKWQPFHTIGMLVGIPFASCKKLLCHFSIRHDVLVKNSTHPSMFTCGKWKERTIYLSPPLLSPCSFLLSPTLTKSRSFHLGLIRFYCKGFYWRGYYFH